MSLLNLRFNHIPIEDEQPTPRKMYNKLHIRHLMSYQEFKKEKKEEKGGKRRGLRLAVAAKLRT